MDMIFFLLLVVFVCGIALYMKAMDMDYKKAMASKVCKPHEWRYHDQDGWVSESDPNSQERLKRAVLLCQRCLASPSDIQTNYHGEY